jgi:hypothetical protein
MGKDSGDGFMILDQDCWGGERERVTVGGSFLLFVVFITFFLLYFISFHFISFLSCHFRSILVFLVSAGTPFMAECFPFSVLVSSFPFRFGVFSFVVLSRR